MKINEKIKNNLIENVNSDEEYSIYGGNPEVMEDALKQSELNDKHIEEVNKELDKSKKELEDATVKRKVNKFESVSREFYRVKSDKELAETVSSIVAQKKKYVINKSLNENYKYNVIITGDK